MPLTVPVRLLLAVSLGCFGVGTPVALLVIGICLTPLLPTISNNLSVFGISCLLGAVVVRTPPALALRTQAHTLIGTEFGSFKYFFAVATGVRGQINSSESCLKRNLSKKSQFANRRI
jgi:hypothetical protein